MYITDFIYDNCALSDYHYIVCDFDSKNGITVSDTGSKISFEKVKHKHGAKHGLVCAKYEECVTSTFDICKDPDVFYGEDRYISEDEYREIVRWLNRKTFLGLSLYGDEPYSVLYCNASFNIKKISIAEEIVGIRLSIETDAPFCYGEEKEIMLSLSNNTMKKGNFEDWSDEIGYIYPDMKITCKESGNLILANNSFGVSMVLNGCTVGEVITIHGDEQIIESSMLSHNIGKDFNYQFFKIGNTYSNRNNEITASIECDIVLTYRPIIKNMF